MPEPIVLVLPIPPSANRLWRNNRVSPEYRKWKEAAGWDAKMQTMGKASIKGQFRARIEVPASRRDLDNNLKPILDLCQAVGVISDDKFAVEIHLWLNLDREPSTIRVELEAA